MKIYNGQPLFGYALMRSWDLKGFAKSPNFDVPFTVEHRGSLRERFIYAIDVPVEVYRTSTGQEFAKAGDSFLLYLEGASLLDQHHYNEEGILYLTPNQQTLDVASRLTEVYSIRVLNRAISAVRGDVSLVGNLDNPYFAGGNVGLYGSVRDWHWSLYGDKY